jgi:predicted permease
MSFPVETLLAAATPVFLLLGLGVFLRQVKILQSGADSALTQMVVRVFYPFLFLQFIIGNPQLKGGENLFLAPLLGFTTISFGFAFAYLTARLIGLERGKGLRSFAFSGGIYNYSYIPIPLMAALFEDTSVLGVLLVFNVGVELAIWTVGILLLTGSLNLKELVQRLFNPPIIAFLVALAVNTSGLDSAMPIWLDRFIALLAGCAIPLGLLLAGATIRDLAGEGSFLQPLKVPFAALAVRALCVPALILALALYLPGLGDEVRQVLVIQAAMPAGVFPIVLARHYGGEPRVVTQVVLTTTVLALVSMPFWVLTGLALLGD